jgi:hypothetical protein
MKQAWILRNLPDGRLLGAPRQALYRGFNGVVFNGVVFTPSFARVFWSAAAAERYRRSLLVPNQWAVVSLAGAMLDHEAARPEAAR